VIDHAATLNADDRLDIQDVQRRVKAIFIGSVGNLVEWYDFYAYTAFALYFAPAFFPNSNPVVQQLNAAVIFAATFLVRPLGGWLFGYIADHHGRRLSLTLSVVCMCFGSLIIAVTPTYASIGFAAPAILALARVIEGLSLGGEYGASATYLAEMAHGRHRGLVASLQYVTLIGGQLVALVVLAIGLLGNGFEWTRVDEIQKIAGIDDRAVAEFDAGDEAADAGANLNLFDRIEPPGKFIPVGDGSLDGLGDRDWRRRSRRLRRRLVIATAQADREDCDHRCELAERANLDHSSLTLRFLSRAQGPLLRTMVAIDRGGLDRDRTKMRSAASLCKKRPRSSGICFVPRQTRRIRLSHGPMAAE